MLIRSASECLFRYELIRCQALESGELSRSLALEMAFLERQGLAAWMAADWSKLWAASESEVVESNHDLVLALADLVLGDREEVAHG